MDTEGKKRGSLPGWAWDWRNPPKPSGNEIHPLPFALGRATLYIVQISK